MSGQYAPRAETVVDLDALRHNVALLAERAQVPVMAVVKADGYGHGAVPIAKAALEAGATWLGSASATEAVDLRKAGIEAPILAWLYAPGEDLSDAVAAGVDLGVSSVDELRAADGARLHLKIDTGLNRNGCSPEDWPELVKAARDHDVHAIWSHLASADEPGNPSIDRQAGRFDEAYEIAVAEGLQPIRHLANSAATLTRPDLAYDMVRVGIAMYGLNPVPQHEDLRPVMTFRSSVVSTKRTPAGEGVSYGHTWVADRDTTLALVPVGYADGVPRGLSGRFEVSLAGQRRPVVGRVCMDQIVVDCGDDPVSPGDEVILFGPGAHGEPTAREWADKLGTIDYEIVTNMYRPRVRRRYVGASS
ncbi:alanine racemase [Kibdelosporangium phytohabitans]|uniref:Alanine racemase n=1 Tax=Kibdelosporangium phytohabitans TaxID=860235 RepID=A0A0N9I1L8_9PSEU|nr:alanine racemase [Kibdelosporangium phytohabitans]ALG13822.1 alanine racemase [Kibdelosporangium phytohabitans]